MIDLAAYESLARETGAYGDTELDILGETLLSWQRSPGQPYTLLDLRDGRTLAGFAVVAKAPNTDFSYDVRYLCIERAYIGKGVSERLIEMLEEEARRLDGSAILRIEISRRKEDAITRGALEGAGFSSIGHIADFYGEGDDYFMYAKYVAHGPEAAEGAPAGPEAAPAAAEGAPEGQEATAPEAGGEEQRDHSGH